MFEQIYEENKNNMVNIQINKNKRIIIKKNGIYNYHFKNKAEINVNIKLNENVNAVINLYYFDDYLINLKLNLSCHSKLCYQVYNYGQGLENVIINSQENSQLKAYIIQIGNCTKSNYIINLNGQNSEVDYNLRIYADGDIKKDNYLKVNHLKQNTKSSINNCGILNNKAISIFDNSSYIKKGCVNANAYQKTKVLSLSEDCQTHISPILIIDDYDVVGGHGATVTKINPEEMYYLNSRGISEESAKKILIMGNLFLGLPNIVIDELNSVVERRIENGKISS